LNPARDLGPRLLHQVFPLKYKGNSNWGYAWVPVVAPILAGVAATILFKSVFM
jgi:glycerol uptake facilitator protein